MKAARLIGAVLLSPALLFVAVAPAIAQQAHPQAAMLSADEGGELCDIPGPNLLTGACTIVDGTEELLDSGEEAVTGVVTGVTEAAVESGAQNLGEVMMAAWDGLMKDFLTSWLDQGLMVDLEGSSVPWLTDQLHVIGVALSVIGIMVACIWTMVHTRGDRAKQAATGLLRVFLVTTLGTAVIQVLLPAGDAFSEWILDNAGLSAKQWEAKATLAIVAANPGLAIIAGFIGAIATLIQWGIMVVRSALIPLLAAVWPTSAAAAMIQGGEQAFSGITRWLIAFVIYKPVAAIIYAFAWKLKSGEDGMGGVITGMIILALGVLALPALLRLLAPATSALGSAAGGTMAIAATGAVVTAGVATGAAVMTGGGSMAMGSAATSGGGLGATAGGTPAIPTAGASSPRSGSPSEGGAFSTHSSSATPPASGTAPPTPAGSPAPSGTTDTQYAGAQPSMTPSGNYGPAGSSGAAANSGAAQPGVTAAGAAASGLQSAGAAISSTIAEGSSHNVDGVIGGGDQ